jgi:hypothetical protein
MKTITNTKSIGAVALATLVAAVAIPVAAASGSAGDPGLVARKLGSPDPREHLTRTQYAPGQVASRLGSPDPRENGTHVQYASGQVASQLGSPDPRDTGLASIAPSAVATELGSPDPRDAGIAQTAVPAGGGGFDWGDFGIGLAFGIGLSAILAGSAILATVALRGRSVAQRLA